MNLPRITSALAIVTEKRVSFRSLPGVAVSLLACAVFFDSSLSSAVATTYVDSFPSGTTTVVASVGAISVDEYGYFWSVSRGDSLTQAFPGTGLNSVDHLELNLDVSQNVLDSGANTFWDVLVNGVTVGNWAWSDASGIGNVDLSYDFSPIVGNGNYTVRMEVTNEVPPGAGSIAIRFPGEMTLEGVPEPATFTLFSSAVVLLGGVRSLRRRRAAA